MYFTDLTPAFTATYNAADTPQAHRSDVTRDTRGQWGQGRHTHTRAMAINHVGEGRSDVIHLRNKRSKILP